MKWHHVKKGLCGLGMVAIIICLNAKGEAFVSEDVIRRSQSIAHYIMAQRLDILGQYQQAVFEYKKSLEFNGSNYLAHLRLGTDYARLNLLTQALSELDLATKLNPSDLQSHYLMAVIYSSQKDYDNAAKKYEYILTQLVNDEPQNAEVHAYLGQLYYSQHKFDQAIVQFEKVLETDQENTEVMYLLAGMHIDKGNKKRAIDLLKKSIELDPTHDGSLNTLGYLYAEENINLDEAEKLVLSALQIVPDNGAYLDSLGWVYYRKGQYSKALDALLKADSLVKDSTIYDHLADVYFQLNKIDDAIKYWELSLKLNPTQDDVLKKLNQAKSTRVSKEN